MAEERAFRVVRQPDDKRPVAELVAEQCDGAMPTELLMSGEVKPTSGQHDFAWIVWEPLAVRANTVVRWLK